MKNCKRLMSGLLACLMLLTFTACGNNDTAGDTSATESTTTTTEEVTTTTAEETTTTTEEVTTTTTEETTTTTKKPTTTTTKKVTTTKKPTTTTTKKPTTTTTTKATTTTTTAPPVLYSEWLCGCDDLHQEFKADGTPSFDLMLWRTCFLSGEDGYYNRELDFNEIPEQEVLRLIRTEFVCTDQQFEALKQQSTYMMRREEDDSYYMDGYFYLQADLGQGGGGWKTMHTASSFEDDKNGVFKVYFDCHEAKMNPEDESTSKGALLYRYVVEYVYEGKGDLYVEPLGDTSANVFSTNEALLKSMRIRSIKKL